MDSVGNRNRTVHLWSLSQDVVVEAGDAEGQLVLTGPWGPERVDGAHAVVRDALHRMELGPVLLANVEPRSGVRLVLLPLLERLSHLVVRTLGVDDLGGPLLSAAPVARTASFRLDRLPGWRPVRLPADVTVRRAPRGVTVESSDAPYRVVLHRPEAAWVLGLLAWPVTPDDASACLDLPPGMTEAILDYLAAAGMAAPADTSADTPASAPADTPADAPQDPPATDVTGASPRLWRS
ncbi:NADH oxidase [Streptomyces sp. TRM64462]|uniref:NADH oxidase n=1 Tax=Streptomyces sp. TRM64462 TaxID=2741726 RepID=UPI0015860CED|nr:NADH oxidase [Streptomyces sp. TRM64462]